MNHPARRLRRFRLLDTFAMIAALAVGYRGYQLVLSIYQGTGIGSAQTVITRIRDTGLLSAPYHVLFWFETAAPMLISLTLTLFLLRRFSARPRRSLLRRQPGAAALAGASLGSGSVFGSWALVGYPLLMTGKWVASGFALSTQYPLILRVMLVSMVAGGAAIAAAWGNLALNGPAWREADWIEWSGRILGMIWLLSTPIYLWSALIVY